MEQARSSTLSPKRLSAVTHGRFAVGPQGMYLQYDSCLNPTCVYGALLRQSQCDWLGKFDLIICETTQDMWILRKLVPGLSGRIHCMYDLDTLDPNSEVLFVEHSRGGYRKPRFIDDYEALFREDSTVLQMNQLWGTTALTISYR